MKTLAGLAGAAIACAASAAPAAADLPPLRAAGVSGPLGDERLSDENTVTRFGYPARRYKVLAAPRKGARVVERLRFFTEDRAPETYLVLRSQVDERGRTWLQIRLPKRPNDSKGWVPHYALGALKTTSDLLDLDKGSLTARFYRSGRFLWKSRVGIGRPGMDTPSGHFWIRERLSNLGGNPAYGPFAFGTSAYSRLSDWPGGGVVGVHGTNQPGLIPGRPSHGCIRVPNAKILKLKQLMRVGTPMWVHR